GRRRGRRPARGARPRLRRQPQLGAPPEHVAPRPPEPVQRGGHHRARGPRVRGDRRAGEHHALRPPAAVGRSVRRRRPSGGPLPGAPRSGRRPCPCAVRPDGRAPLAPRSTSAGGGRAAGPARRRSGRHGRPAARRVRPGRDMGLTPPANPSEPPAPIEPTSLPAPPDAPRGPTVDVVHGVEVPDPYRWLEDADSPATQAWVEAGNARTRTLLDTRPDRAGMVGRYAELFAAGSSGAPSIRGGRLFSIDRWGDLEQAVLVVRDLHGERVP